MKDFISSIFKEDKKKKKKWVTNLWFKHKRIIKKKHYWEKW